MNALIDTNVIVDVLTARAPHYEDSAMVLDKAERGEFVATICATTITTVYYLVRRHHGAKATLETMLDLTAICHVSPVNRSVIDSALHSSFRDFEDAVLHHSALLAGADCIVTRNQIDFRDSSLMIYSPRQFLIALAQEQKRESQ